MEKNLFAYGSLMCQDIMTEVCGISLIGVPATLKGFRRIRVRNEHYPALVPAPDGCVDGTVYPDVPDTAWKRLDRFEGDLYERLDVNIQTAGDVFQQAYAYVAKSKFFDLLEETEWDFGEFLKSGKTRFRNHYGGYGALKNDSR